MTGGVLVGEIAHIQGPLPASPRFNPDMTNEQRREYENLLMLCGTHHTIIDTAVDEWSVSKLQDLKSSHEARATVISPAVQDMGASAPVLPIEAMVNRWSAVCRSRDRNARRCGGTGRGWRRDGDVVAGQHQDKIGHW